ncbi:sigma-70 family RNA polymerase sigma factor [Paenisporosarcina sp. TG20]|uniref:sigma-70 family RNA polymerase sigma factor n=1 Tax=Paenisporosarcina sp. TG20 TaxID=1211706 RepID=UPI0002E62D30|nr:sigma-70 family RNA polymerase sigma factor [Paenisporosarcina sp. TG20]
MLNLVKKAQKGNDIAFLTLFQKCEEDIYRTAFVYVKNQSDALDIVQETAYRSFKSIKSLENLNYFKTWLIRITINCALDVLHKRENVVQLKSDFEGFISGDVNEDISFEMTILDLIECLNEDEKSVIILRFYKDLTIKEVAETLNLPLGTAKTLLYRALKKLRKGFKGDGVHEQ